MDDIEERIIEFSQFRLYDYIVTASLLFNYKLLRIEIRFNLNWFFHCDSFYFYVSLLFEFDCCFQISILVVKHIVGKALRHWVLRLLRLDDVSLKLNERLVFKS